MPVKLSASRIDTLNTCSWVYHCNYILKLPDTSNDGAKRGTVTHDTLELLLADREAYDIIVAKQDPFAVEKYKDFILAKAAELEVDDDENLAMIKEFILTALDHDFFCEGSDEIKAEGKFDINNPKPAYHITGFIDQLAIYEKESRVFVRDFKTSKLKFDKQKREFNIQAMMYCLAARHKYPHLTDREFSFLFLKFGKKAEQKIPAYTNEQLDGFETYLEYLNEYVNTFDLKKAHANFAKDNVKTYWLCGKRRGDTKKDGSPAWVCNYKYPYDYWAAVDGDGKPLKCSKEEDDQEFLDFVAENNLTVVKKHYGGCPKFRGEKSK